jgi:integrase
VKDSNAKYDHRNGGNQEWRNRIGTIRLEKVKPELVAGWMKKFVANAGSSPTAITAAKRTANSYVRCARSLFSSTILTEPPVKKLTLPVTLPFQGIELFETGSTKYISKINAKALIAAARQELAKTDSEAYKVFLLGLLGGMRKGEIDLCEWRMIDWKNHIIRLEETEWLRLKTPDSAGEITVDSEVLSALRKLMPASQSPFIVSSLVTYKRGLRTISRIRPPRPDSARRYYRCEPVFKRLYDWLRTKGVTANKPLHELRKEIGALIATEHGIFAASTYLRHSDITTTARHYADHKTRISVGLGKCLRKSPKK